jgi:transcriptional regulator with XRE-family HTH domain
MKTKATNLIDRHVGSRVRMRRLMLDMSQSSLANELGITFQQVQKYEKGTNRIGASRLEHTAFALKVAVAFFFEGLPDFTDKSVRAAAPSDELDKFMTTREGLDLARAFTRITKPAMRRKIADLVEEIVGGKLQRDELHTRFGNAAIRSA